MKEFEVLFNKGARRFEVSCKDVNQADQVLRSVPTEYISWDDPERASKSLRAYLNRINN